MEFVALTAGDQLFCIEIRQILELRRWSPVTALPHSPPDVLGVINLRGAVIPIIDLAARFGLSVIEVVGKATVYVLSFGVKAGVTLEDYVHFVRFRRGFQCRGLGLYQV